MCHMVVPAGTVSDHCATLLAGWEQGEQAFLPGPRAKISYFRITLEQRHPCVWSPHTTRTYHCTLGLRALHLGVHLTCGAVSDVPLTTLQQSSKGVDHVIVSFHDSR